MGFIPERKFPVICIGHITVFLFLIDSFRLFAGFPDFRFRLFQIFVKPPVFFFGRFYHNLVTFGKAAQYFFHDAGKGKDILYPSFLCLTGIGIRIEHGKTEKCFIFFKSFPDRLQ